MKYLKVLFIITFTSVFFAACNSTTQQESNPLVTPPAQPESDKATVIGRILAEDTGEPLGNTIVRLSEVVRQGEKGAYILDVAFSPGADSDMEGFFIFENVDPLEYVIVVGDVYEVYEVIAGEDGNAQTWVTAKGEVTDVGELLVDLSP